MGVGAELTSSHTTNLLRVAVLCFLILTVAIYLAIQRNLIKVQVAVVFLVVVNVLLARYFFGFNGDVLNFVYLTIIVFLLNSLSINRLELAKVLFFSSIISVSIYIGLYIEGGGDGGPVKIGSRERYYFGFVNPNKAALVFFSLYIFSWISLIERLGGKLISVSSLVLSIVIIYFTGSRTALLLALFFPVLIVVLHFSKNKRFLAMAFFFVSVAASFLLAILNDSAFLNELLSNRPHEFGLGLSELTWAQFLFGGSSIEQRVDNSYLQFIFSFGAFGLVIFLLLITLRTRYVASSSEVSTIIIVSIYGMSEKLLMSPELLISIYFYGLLFLKKENVKTYYHSQKCIRDL